MIFTAETIHDLLTNPDAVQTWAAVGRQVLAGGEQQDASIYALLRTRIEEALLRLEGESSANSLLRDLYSGKPIKVLAGQHGISRQALYKRRDKLLQLLADTLNTSLARTKVLDLPVEPLVRRESLERRVISLLLDDDGAFAIVGPAGRGKRTLLNICLADGDVWRKYGARIRWNAGSDESEDPEIRVRDQAVGQVGAVPTPTDISRHKHVVIADTAFLVRHLPEARLVHVPAFTDEEARACLKMWTENANVDPSHIADVMRSTTREPIDVCIVGRRLRTTRPTEGSFEPQAANYDDPLVSALSALTRSAQTAIRALCCFPPAPNTMSQAVLNIVGACGKHAVDELLESGLIFRAIHGRVGVFRLVHDHVARTVQSPEKLEYVHRYAAMITAGRTLSTFDLNNMAEAVQLMHAENDADTVLRLLLAGDVALVRVLGPERWSTIHQSLVSRRLARPDRARLAFLDALHQGIAIDPAALQEKLSVLMAVSGDDPDCAETIDEAREFQIATQGQVAERANLFDPRMWESINRDRKVYERVGALLSQFIGGADGSVPARMRALVVSGLTGKLRADTAHLVEGLRIMYDYFAECKVDITARTSKDLLLRTIESGSDNSKVFAAYLTTWIHHFLGDYATAGWAVNHARNADASKIVPMLRGQFATVAGLNEMAQGQYRESRTTFLEGLKVCSRHDVFLVPAGLAYSSARMFYDINSHAELESAALLAREHASLVENREFKGMSQMFVGLAYAMKGNGAKAIAATREALEWAKVGQSNSDRWTSCFVRLYGGTTLVWSRDEAGRKLLMDAVADAERLKQPEYKFRALWALAIEAALANDSQRVEYFGDAAISIAKSIGHILAGRMTRALVTGTITKGSFGPN